MDDASNAISTAVKMLIEINNLNVRFRRFTSIASALSSARRRYVNALRNVSLHLDVGETLGLIGESGSGKSTLGRTIMGLEPAWSGSIKLDGRELVGLTEHDYRPVRRDMAMIFQDSVASLSPRKNVYDLIVEPYRIHGYSGPGIHERARDLLQSVGLEEGLFTAYPHQLSGGQARRVGIARALALDPKLIIADEPTAGLDVSVQGEIINLMNRLQDEKKIAYLFITHNLAIARHVSDRLAILYRGSLCETGPSDLVMNRPAHPYTEELVQSTPTHDPCHRRLRARAKIENELIDNLEGCPFYGGCRYTAPKCRSDFPEYSHLSDARRIRCHFPLVSKGA